MGHNVEHIVGELTECLETLLVSIGDRSGTANLLMTKEFSERCIEALKNSPHLQNGDRYDFAIEYLQAAHDKAWQFTR